MKYRPTCITVKVVTLMRRCVEMEKIHKAALRVQELAGLLGVSPSLVYREARLGRLTHFRVGRTVRIPVDAAEEFIRRVRVEAGQSG